MLNIVLFVHLSVTRTDKFKKIKLNVCHNGIHCINMQ